MDATSVQQSGALQLHDCIDQSFSSSPGAVGWSFAADVIKRSRQLIFILRGTVTSYTSNVFLETSVTEHYMMPL